MGEEPKDGAEVVWHESLSDKEGEALTALLNEKFGTLTCEACGHEEWTVNPSLATPEFIAVDFVGKQFGITGEQLHPCAVIHCTNCGNTKLHSLRHMGFDLFAARDAADG